MFVFVFILFLCCDLFSHSVIDGAKLNNFLQTKQIFCLLFALFIEIFLLLCYFSLKIRIPAAFGTKKSTTSHHCDMVQT